MKTRILLIALMAVLTWSFTAPNSTLDMEVTTSETDTKIVCIDNKEVVMLDLDEEMGIVQVPIIWKNDAEYQGSMNWQQIRTDTRTFYQSMGMAPIYHVVDNNREVWVFNIPGGGFPGSDVEAVMGKDDNVDVDGD
ncbi:MAG: hypothetical protein AAF466_00060 [Bacteroidota bacterium]